MQKSQELVPHHEMIRYIYSDLILIKISRHRLHMDVFPL